MRVVLRSGSAAVLVPLGLGAAVDVWWWATTEPHSIIALALAIAAIPAGMAIAEDIRSQRLPNRLTAIIGLIGCLLATVEAISGRTGAISGGLLGAFLAALPLLVVHLLSRGRLGFGDVKFAAVLGLVAGVAHPLYAMMIPMLAASAGMFGSILLGEGRRAFGPALGAGAVIALLAAPIWIRSIGGPLLWT